MLIIATWKYLQTCPLQRLQFFLAILITATCNQSLSPWCVKNWHLNLKVICDHCQVYSLWWLLVIITYNQIHSKQHIKSPSMLLDNCAFPNMQPLKFKTQLTIFITLLCFWLPSIIILATANEHWRNEKQNELKSPNSSELVFPKRSGKMVDGSEKNVTVDLGEFAWVACV